MVLQIVGRPFRLKRRTLKYIGVLCFWAFILTNLLRYGYGDHFVNLRNRYLKYFAVNPEENSCYRADIEDREPQENIFAENSIFLITANCNHFITMHEACVVESVIRNHEERKIYALFARNIPYRESRGDIIRGLRSAKNVNIYSINIDKFIKNTPLEGIFTDHFLNTGVKTSKRVREVLKLAALYRFGGVVIDLEMVMARSVNFLGQNWIGYINNSTFGGAILALNKNTGFGKRLLKKSFMILKRMQNYEELDIGELLTEAYQKICTHYDEECAEFKRYKPSYFYPFKSTENHKYFEPGELINFVYGYYIWDFNGFLRNKDTVYTKLVKEFCPSLDNYLSNFHNTFNLFR